MLNQIASLPPDPTPYSHYWDSDGNWDGGVSGGVGFFISWSRDQDCLSGAVIISVLQACANQLAHYQAGKFRCQENQWALGYLEQAIAICQVVPHLTWKSQTHPEYDFASNWTDFQTGNHEGGLACGLGWAIGWQRGDRSGGRNGAFLMEVLQACCDVLIFYQGTTDLWCNENAAVYNLVSTAIGHLQARVDRRIAEGTFGTHQV